jgi:hypothetical protein
MENAPTPSQRAHTLQELERESRQEGDLEKADEYAAEYNDLLKQHPEEFPSQLYRPKVVLSDPDTWGRLITSF